LNSSCAGYQNYLDLGQCYLPQPSASADNIDLGLNNFGYPAQPHPIIVKNYLTPSWNAATAPVEINNNNHYFSSNETLNPFNEIKSKKGFKIEALNITALLKHIEELTVVMTNNPFEVLAINE
jgi:hypothetical protein